MNIKNLRLRFAALFIACLTCSGITSQNKYDLEFTLQPSQQYQKMHCFGASDAWHTQHVGKNWPLNKKEQVADWLFSQQFDKKGNPKGIGLSLWRFNIGAGSTEIGNASKITDTWKRMECFLSSDGSYDWNKQAGQQWFMHAAKKRGTEYLLAFSNAAPYFMTRNGTVYSPDSININLRDDQYKPFAHFLANVMEHFHKVGLYIDYLSPLNEPQVNWWVPRQEGMFATNAECYKIIKELDDEFTARKLPNKIIFGEAGSYDYLYSDSTNMPNTDDQIEAFFSPKGCYSLRNFKSVLPIVSGHPYWSTWDYDKMINMRKELSSKIAQVAPGIEFWSSEYCILEKNEWMPNGGENRDLSMHTALYVSRIIHADITLAQATSWQWWLGITSSDWKDGLVYLDRSSNKDWRNPTVEETELLKLDGNCRASKNMWVLGNYSLFIRPGMIRIGVTRNDNIPLAEELKSVMVSAYKNQDNGKSVVVITNITDKGKRIKLNGLNRFKCYCTNDKNNLAYVGTKSNEVEVPAKSVVTLVEK